MVTLRQRRTDTLSQPRQSQEFLRLRAKRRIEIHARPAPALQRWLATFGDWTVHVGARDADASLAPAYTTWLPPLSTRHMAAAAYLGQWSANGWRGFGWNTSLTDMHVIVFPRWGDELQVVAQAILAAVASLTVVTAADPVWMLAGARSGSARP